jgi:hypothetical protein
MKSPAHADRAIGLSCRPSGKAGQALIESFAVIVLLCLILFGIVQYVLMLTATEIVQYSADASVRARAVGFNRFMVYKVSRVASIPNAGLMRTPDRTVIGNQDLWNQQRAGEAFRTAIAANPRSRQYRDIEQYTIPLYLGTENWGTMYGLLDYEDWDTVSSPLYSGTTGTSVGVSIRQDFPLRMPLYRVLSEDESLPIRKEARLADHAALYLE